MEAAQSGTKKTNQTLFTRSSVIFLALLSCSLLCGFGPKSSVTLGIGTDSEKSPSGFIDSQIILPFMMQINGGLSSTRVNFEEQGEGLSRDIYLGVGSNPMRDWVFDLQLEVADPSDHLKVSTLTSSVQYFVSDFSLRLTLGVQSITAQVTDRLGAVCALVNYAGTCAIIAGSPSEVKDQSGQWGLSVEYYMTDRWSLRANFYDYSYEKDLTLFTDQRIVNVDYFADTISFASGFLNYRSGLGASYDWSKYSLSFELGKFVNQFNSDQTNQLVASFGWQFTKSWYLMITQGLSRSEAEDEEQSVAGSFTNTAISFSW